MSEWHTGWTEGYASARSEAQAEIEKLRAALKPFADEAEYIRPEAHDDDWYDLDAMRIGHFRAAAAALRETGDE